MTDERTATLLHSLKLGLFIEMNSLADEDDWESETPEIRAYYDRMVFRVGSDLLTEIESRCTARGYDWLDGYIGREPQIISVSDFLAEIRGELEG